MSFKRGGDDDYGLFDGYESTEDPGSSSNDNFTEESSNDMEDEEGGQQMEVESGSILGAMDDDESIDEKLGMATCEMCGIVGARDTFFSKTKRFCSVSCSRSYSSNSKKSSILARLQGKPPTKKAKVLNKASWVSKLGAFLHQSSGEVRHGNHNSNTGETSILFHISTAL
ncbi:lethal(3)malignant brain tumor-like protein 2 [Scyliorhinus canicula]|uniref:lethal(3)malignant brain tumor-like protein 2 n=1 Tax=Scyliorhinus canicula TaxID=7830 RepID=UPI0018F70413|nr:lethal(3)malignant brain tumor-like protein 2 [Scyliorhinus canicula]